MIFSGNTTALGASTIPMAEGYDCSYGASLALVESARNDLAVFKAMVQADYREMAICKESTGVMQEGEISALHEAVGGGIFKKIAELFRKLVAKIKSIFHNFMSKINGLVMKDKELVKKYGTELGRKTNLGKLEIKWRKPAEGHNAVEFGIIDAIGNFDESKAVSAYKEDTWERAQVYLSEIDSKFGNVDSSSEFIKEYIDSKLGDEETVTLDSIGGWRKVAGFISDYDKKLKTMNSNINKTTSNLEKLVKKYDDKASNLTKASMPGGTGEVDGEKADDTSIGKANKQYDMAQAYQTVTLNLMQATQQIATIEYKQNKAAFMKAVAANPKKLEESAILLDAIAEAAEDEVDNVIGAALSDEELSKLSAASTNVKDGDVSDDPDKLTYGPDCYTDHPEVWNGTDGNIDSCIGGGKVEESAYFGKLFF